MSSSLPTIHCEAAVAAPSLPSAPSSAKKSQHEPER
jgi:hypothetical protein